MNKFRLTSLVRLSYLAPGIVRAFLAGRHPIALTPTRLLRLSKDLPHDWQEQRHFLGFGPENFLQNRTKRSTSDNSKMASRDPARVHAPYLGVWHL